MYECEIGQGLLGNSVARAVGGTVQNATLPFLPGEPLAAKSSKEALSNFIRRDLLVLSAAIASHLKSKLTIRKDRNGVGSVI